jgi:putative PIN family toxin of toxin-antitoxin system
MKAVFDTNVLVSALISAGTPRLLFEKAVKKQIQLILSEETIAEFNRVVSDPRIRKYVNSGEVTVFLDALYKSGKIIKLKSQFKAVKEDSDDDMIVITASDGKADIIVSGDKHLLTLGTFRGIKILTVNQTLTLLTENK